MKKIINENENPDFLTDFLNYKLIIQNMSENTVKEYNYDLLHFLRYVAYEIENFNIKNDGNKINDENEINDLNIIDLKKEVLKKISLKDLHNFLAYIKKYHNNTATSLSRKVSSIRSFFKYFNKVDGYLEDNPASNLDSPKLPKRIPKYLNIDEAKRLLEASKTNVNKRNEQYISRNHAILTIFLNCGIRLSELVGMNISDINLSTRMLKVTGKGNKERNIYLNDACIKSLNEYMKDRPKNISKKYEDALFLSNQKKRISRRGVQYIVEGEIKKAGLDSTKYSVHKLRHTAATLMYQYGDADISALQKVLGHETISTTEIYTHAENYEVKRAIENNPLSGLD